jgi:ribosomal protein L10
MAEHKISKAKVEAVKRIAQILKGAKCVMLVSIKSLPAAQFQKMKKELRGKADLEVAKKSLLIRAMDASGIDGIEGLKANVKEEKGIFLKTIIPSRKATKDYNKEIEEENEIK